MERHRLDETLRVELLEGFAGERAVDLQPLNKNRGSNKLHLGNVGEKLLVGRLVKEDEVERLFAHLSFAPLLLLLLGATAHGGLGLCLLRFLGSFRL